MTERHRRIAESPDVQMQPSPTEPWSHPAWVCPCGAFAFLVSRWGCVNGVKDKAEATCTRCETKRLWDWNAMRWTFGYDRELERWVELV